jgi:phosphoglycerol transferase MdoB-like AlkP superfamily enzyme
LIALIAIGISFLTRLVLAGFSLSNLEHNPVQVAGIFLIGLFYDLVFCTYLVIPFVLHRWFISDRIYQKPWKFIAIGVYTILIGLFYFTNLIPKEYNKKLGVAVAALFAVRLVIFIFLSSRSDLFRKKWRRNVWYVVIILVIFLLLFNAVSEFFFWQEFSARYNFIAVDYLIYTTEVIGNIRESYPLPAIIALVFAISLLVFFFIKKQVDRSHETPRPVLLKRTAVASGLLSLAALSFFLVTDTFQKFSDNSYMNELAGNGLYDFGVAFNDNKLDFEKYYATISNKEAFTILRQQLSNPGEEFTSNDIYNIERKIKDSLPEKKYNVVLVSIESFSASFMQAFGSKQSITPYLDSLTEQSLFFTNCFATGTRTVRGLEALSVGIIPTPGQSIVKRRDDENGNLFSLASVLNSKGYHSEYIYGGYSYFDNMGSFFSRNGYEVVDRSALKPQDIHYANVWGVADEDLFSLAIKKMDEDHEIKKPFFTHIMTVSNHRPFTYPDGRIDIPSDSKTREGGVKYTDFAIHRFLNQARSRPWFSNTIFVFVADHCASAAGKTALPVTGYHIPLLIYAPYILTPQKINSIVSQIDVEPTILGILHMSYKSKFFGRDILKSRNMPQRAFISTYQSLGFLTDSTLITLSPVKQKTASKVNFSTGNAVSQPVKDSLGKIATAWYQCANWLLQKKMYAN